MGKSYFKILKFITSLQKNTKALVNLSLIILIYLEFINL